MTPWHDLDPKARKIFDGLFNAVALVLLIAVIVLCAVGAGA